MVGAQAFVISAFACLLASNALAQQQWNTDIGKWEYDSNCAVCHGTTGKGDGSYKAHLLNAPPNLTNLTRANGGVFPFQRVYEIIAGRIAVSAHGPREMPIWGDDYLDKSMRRSTDLLLDPEALARARTLALIDYLNRLQAK